MIINCFSQSDRGELYIRTNVDSVFMGQTISLEAFYISSGDKKQEVVLLPFIDERRWGAHERTDSNGFAQLLIPLPNIGLHEIKVMAVPVDTSNWFGVDQYSKLVSGKLIPEKGVFSNAISVYIKWKNYNRPVNDKTLIGLQWEPWFTTERKWVSPQAIPLLGFYNYSTHGVLRQHILWFMELGIDFIIPDWSNNNWGHKHWDERKSGTNIIIQATGLMLEELARMRDEGLPVPKVALMPGLSNGPPSTMGALNEQLDWIYHYYLRNPRFKGLWQFYEEKPLIIVLDTGALGKKDLIVNSITKNPLFESTLGMDEKEMDIFRKEQPPVNDTHFTVKWMSSQNQNTKHNELGYWSWMDGSLLPKVTFNKGNAEAVTVTPAMFPPLGWTNENAYGRRKGWTYLKSFIPAIEHRPDVIIIHQFNEFVSHRYGPDKSIYADSYTVELSDDIEPVSVTSIGFQGDNGGWGFYYFNLTKAMLNIYKNPLGEASVMAMAPVKLQNNNILIEWTTIGVKPENYSVFVDEECLGIIEGESFEFPLNKIDLGEIMIKVVANGVQTCFELSKYQIDKPESTFKPLYVVRKVNVMSLVEKISK